MFTKLEKLNCFEREPVYVMLDTDMSSETAPLQYNIFGELEDTRSRSQRRADRERLNPQQAEMFSQRELAQYVNPHPEMDFDPGILILISEDPRTPEEIEADQRREEERLNYMLFEAVIFEAPTQTAIVVFDAQVARTRGLRYALRQQGNGVRSRPINE